ncbi:MAG: VWA domain-containing protein [Bacteroidales bacterium]
MPRPVRTTIVLAALLLAAFATVLSALATSPRPGSIVAQKPDQQPTFRAGVDVVTVDVSVSRSAEPVGGLQAANFEVFDNGTKQKIDKVTLEQVPLEAYLLFDLSGSIAGAKLKQLEDAANAFLDGLTMQDKAALITFAEKSTVLQELTGNREALRKALSDMKAGGNTALYDAAVQTIAMRKHNDRRAVLLVLTDQGDNASEKTEKQAIQAAERSDVIAYGVLAEQSNASAVMSGPLGGFGGGGSFRPPQMQFQLGFLRSLAETTGGRVFRTSSQLRLEDAFGLVLDDARARYVLTYSPDKPTPGWHKLQVKLLNVKADVLARRGYYVDQPATAK